MKFLVFFIFFVSLYFCIGGVGDIINTSELENARSKVQSPVTGEDGYGYMNPEELQATDKQKDFRRYFPILDNNSTLSFIIILMSFGALGSLFRQILRVVAAPKDPIDYNQVTMWAALGMLTGLIVVVLDDLLLPEFKYESGEDKVYYSMAILGGIYTETLFKWLSEKVETRLSESRKKEKSTAEET